MNAAYEQAMQKLEAKRREVEVAEELKANAAKEYEEERANFEVAFAEEKANQIAAIKKQVIGLGLNPEDCGFKMVTNLVNAPTKTKTATKKKAAHVPRKQLPRGAFEFLRVLKINESTKRAKKYAQSASNACNLFKKKNPEYNFKTRTLPSGWVEITRLPVAA